MSGNKPDYEVLIVGAGFSGMYMLHRMRELGLSVRVIEAGDGVGGAWYWNRYPGCRCDVPSWEYSYSFDEDLQQEWTWTERYPSQPEILRYLNHVADRFDLRPDIEFETRVESTSYDDKAGLWTVTAEDKREFTCKWLVMASGGLSRPKDPGIPGLDKFKGQVIFTSQWPHEPVELEGKRIGVIGTGSSGIQTIPQLAKVAEKLTVFQRTPQFTIPARNRPLEPNEMDAIKARYPEIRADAQTTGFGLAEFKPSGLLALESDEATIKKEFDRRWAEGGPAFLVAFDDLMLEQDANAYAAAYVRERIAEIVDDPKVADILTPKGYPLGCKRLCNDTDYYKTYNLPNVNLVDVGSAPIERLSENALHTASGEEYPLDILVLATGFDALTGALTSIDVRGRDGLHLKDRWANGPDTYLGIMVDGFPNMFTITGPGSPSLLSNMISSIEHHVGWVTDCIEWMNEKGNAAIEPAAGQSENWMDHVQEVAASTLFGAPNCNSYYLGDNIKGKARKFLPYAGGYMNYKQRMNEVASAGYEGFTTR
ncbi:MAG: NAD(P)/FAD-dependent oxidoreductase [Pseudomonadota bacterium]